MITIRKANTSDIEGIAKVHFTTMMSTYKDLMPDDFLAARTLEERTAKWNETFESDYEIFFVAESEGNIVGFCGGAKNDLPDLKDKYEYELKKIYVLKEYQGQGVGKMLIKKFVSKVKELGYNSLFLWVLGSNPYRRFYDKLGGKVVAEKEYHPAGYVLKGEGYGWENLDISFKTE
ncbi:MAG: GNAT family N-acetyltransferase [Candidatus Delongbacteria bacterium]|jgi:ribosomal protein S18 acetylase RimI-like enzyme|nr:GNAT family N-acetyltransferase [Candidatus Delongbacteria bacterium]